MKLPHKVFFRCVPGCPPRHSHRDTVAVASTVARRVRAEQRRWSLAMPPAALASEPAAIPRGRTAGSRAADSGTSVSRARMPFDHSPVTDREVRRSTPSRRATYRWPTCWPLAAGGVPLRVAAAALPGTATSQLVTPRSRAKAPVFISRLRVGSTVCTSRDRSTSLFCFFKRDRSTSRSGRGWLSEHVTPTVRSSWIHAL